MTKSSPHTFDRACDCVSRFRHKISRFCRQKVSDWSVSTMTIVGVVVSTGAAVVDLTLYGYNSPLLLLLYAAAWRWAASVIYSLQSSDPNLISSMMRNFWLTPSLLLALNGSATAFVIPTTTARRNTNTIASFCFPDNFDRAMECATQKGACELKEMEELVKVAFKLQCKIEPDSDIERIVLKWDLLGR